MQLVEKIRSAKAFGSESCSRGFLQSSLYALFSKVIAIFTSILIAYFFGANESTDIYFFSFSMVVLVATFLSSVNVTILIPQTLRLRERVGFNNSVSFLNTFIYFFSVISILLSFWLFSDTVNAFSFFSKFEKSAIIDNVHIIRMCSLLFPLMVLNLFLSEILFSFRLFTVSIGFNILNSLLILFFVVLFHQRFGIVSALYGALLAYSLQFLAQYLLLFLKFHWHLRFSFKEITSKLFSDAIWAQTGNAFSIFSSYFPIYLLSSYNNGIITALNYGIKIADTITTLITVHFASVIGTKLNEMFARNENGQINQVFRRSANIIVFIMVPISVCISIYSTEIIEVIFRRGAFDYASAQLAASFLKIYVLVLPFIGLNAIVARLFMAAQKINISVFFQILTSCVMITSVYISIEFLGPIGYPVTYVSVFFFGVIFIYYIIKRNISEVNYRLVLADFVRIIILNLPIILIVYFYNKIAGGNSLLNIFSGFSLYFFLVIFLNQFFKCNNELNKIAEINIWPFKTVQKNK